MKIISNTGRDWSRVTAEIEGSFNSWLLQSEISKKDFLKRANKDSFRIRYLEEKDITISLIDNIGIIGLSLVWNKNSNIPCTYFKTDAALFLLYISSMCSSDKTKKHIENFIKTNKLNE